MVTLVTRDGLDIPVGLASRVKAVGLDSLDKVDTLGFQDIRVLVDILGSQEPVVILVYPVGVDNRVGLVGLDTVEFPVIQVLVDTVEKADTQELVAILDGPGGLELVVILEFLDGLGKAGHRVTVEFQGGLVKVDILEYLDTVDGLEFPAHRVK